MPLIQLTDGRTVQLPDGMSRDEMKAALDKLPQSQPTAAANLDADYGPGGGLLGQFGQGATFNLLDEMGAGLRAGTVGAYRGIKHAAEMDGASLSDRADRAAQSISDTYNLRLSDIRDSQAKFQQDKPLQAAGAQIAGAIGSGGALPLGTIGAAATRGGRIARGAGIGAGLGAVSGAGAGEGGFVDRAESALKGGALGAALGTATSALGEFAGPAWTRIKALFGGSVDDRDMEKLSQALQRDNTTPEQLAQRLTDAQQQAPGTPLGIADVMGKDSSTGQLLRTSRDIAGPAGADIDATLAARDEGIGQRGAQDLFVDPNSGATNRIVGRLNDLSGQNALAAREDIIAGRDKTSGTLYGALRDSAPVMPAGDLGDLWTRPSFKAALKKVQMDHADLGEPSIGDYVDFNDAGDPMKVKGGLPFSVIDRTKRALDKQISAGVRQGNDISPLMATKKALVAKADSFWTGDRMNGIPSYSEARMAFSGPTQSAEAIEHGQAFLTRRPEENAAIIRDLAPEDVDLFKTGVYQSLVDKVENTPNGANEIKRLIGNRRSQQQLQSIFSPEEVDHLANLFGWENRAYETKAMMGGSQTAPRASRMTEFGEDVAAPALAEFAQGLQYGSPTRAALGTIGALGKRGLGRAIEGLNAQTASDLGQALLTIDPAEQGNILARLSALPAAQKEKLAGQIIFRNLLTRGSTQAVQGNN